MKKEDFHSVHMARIIVPPDRGVFHVLNNYYWVVVNNYVLFYAGTPQCNKNKRIVENWSKGPNGLLFPDAQVIFIERAYVPYFL